ncbi:MAG: hypothetical protein MUO60_10905, partial [Clostridiaceae bacterium]|nr:hypothetical protein [Clostridiaceae bacterium]
GESDNYGVKDHIKAINKHAHFKAIDCVLVNIGEISSDLENLYLKDNSIMVNINEKEVTKLGIKVIKNDFVKVIKGHVRHDEEKLAAILVETIMEKKLFYDKKKIVDYLYLSHSIKENKDNKE